MMHLSSFDTHDEYGAIWTIVYEALKSKLQITITIIRASDLRLMANIELLTSELLDLMNDEHMSDELKELILQVRRGYSTSKLFRHNIRAVL
jgi:hypothetical protein